MNVPQYIESITEKAKDCFSICQKARLKGYDPQRTVDIPLVKNVGERVEGLVGSVVPGIVGKGIPDRIKELETQYGTGDWRVSFVISAEVAKQKFCKFESNEKAMEIAVRVGLAYITLGIVSAPLEGFVELKIRKRRDGGEYISCYYAGPIRASGGTAAAVSVLIADYVRKEMGYATYDPDENEINRYMAEIEDYHTRVARLQYHPTKEELSMLLNKVPIEINGDPTATIDVSNYKDLPRVETNSIRGGMCLVVAEGLCLKAKKVFKNVKKWGKEFGMEHWNFLDDFLKLQTEIHSKGAAGETKESDSEIKPNYRYLEATVAGRPVLSYPLETGGFRIRYGRSRLSGLAGDSIHPATMILLNGFIATGTQLAVERPGKATVITPCDSIEGPVVKLKNGDVVRVNDVETAKKIKDNLVQIIFLGDMLSNYGDFSQNGQKLIPSGYVEEWWIQELEKTKAKEELPKEFFVKNNFMYKFPSPEEAINLSDNYNVPLHPKYTYHWHDIKKEEVVELVKWISKSENVSNNKIVLEMSDKKLILETLCLPHKVVNDMIVIEEHSYPLLYSLGYCKENKFNVENIEKLEKESTNALELVNKLSPVKIRAKAPIYLGCRMGRPEKAKMRAMKGSPHCLFPCGEEGGRHRSFNAAMEKGKVKSDFPMFLCEKCSAVSAFQFCLKCGSVSKKVKKCTKCGKYVEEDSHCGNKTLKYEKREIPIEEYLKFSESYLKEKIPELVKGVRGMSSESKVPENIMKGILRAKHDVYVNKDGTIRFDMTEAPITHFYPKEIGISLKKLKELGYEKDVDGRPIESDEQLVELFPQDVIMPQCEEWEEACSVTSLIKICNFIDDLLIRFYKQDPYYKVKSKSDLIGQLIVCLAPHTSAGILGRIIGFSNTQCFFAHPYLHCATRRNCDGDEDGIIMLMDAFLNFSRDFLPNKRGSKTMDAPLVLTTCLDPLEIDDEVYAMDIVDKYPAEFYEMTQTYKYSGDVTLIKQVKDRLGKPEQYEGLMFTHPTSSINLGIKVSSYKSLKTMEDKIKMQMDLAKKIKAVKESNMAGLIINNHFLRDIKGNLRKFSEQEFRCVACNEKFRRVPLVGRCTKCNGKIIFTVSEGFVNKYMQSCLNLSENYHLDEYLKQTLEILKRKVDSLFGWETEKQTGLAEFFGAKSASKTK